MIPWDAPGLKGFRDKERDLGQDTASAALSGPRAPWVQSHNPKLSNPTIKHVRGQKAETRVFQRGAPEIPVSSWRVTGSS